MKSFNQMISELSQEEMVQILRDNKVLQEKGVIDNCTLREVSRKIEENFDSSLGAAYWMNVVVNCIAIKLATEHYCN